MNRMRSLGGGRPVCESTGGPASDQTSGKIVRAAREICKETKPRSTASARSDSEKDSVDAGDEDAKPPVGIGPGVDDCESGLRKQVLRSIDGEFIAVFGVDG